ncbi:MAG: molybdopterin-dependent oxidoreductase, partial [Dehalococcoidia bacterium]|nr:molybdopterin-dependent oxidoreductase [Dehalococcoidia bacterium]
AKFILSIGADFHTGWVSQVQYGVAYGQFRGRPGNRGVLVQVEPRITATGASADQWFPIKPGTEGTLALGLANVIISQGLAAGGFAPGSPLPDLQAVSQATGIPQDQIVNLARRFATQTPSLALGGDAAAAYSNGRFNLDAIYSLNRLVGSVGKPGGILPNPRSPLPEVPEAASVWPFSRWQELVTAIRNGQPVTQSGTTISIVPPQVLLVRDANPVYGLHPALGFGEVLDKIPFIASFSSYMDETTAQADLILPGHTFLEDWGSDIPEPGPGFQVVGFQQPVVNPFYDTRSFGDVILTLAEELNLARDLPWTTFKDVLRDGSQALFKLQRGSVQAAGFEEYWMRLRQRGGWWDEKATGTISPAAAAPAAVVPVIPTFAGSEQEYPFYLLPFPSASLREGDTAFLPWPQATPDPITTIVWQTWVEVSLETAEQLALQQGDIVRVESPQGNLEAVVYPHPGLRPDVVAIPMGQGHSGSGIYAKDRGANVLAIVQPQAQGSDGGLARASTRVRLVKTGKSIEVSKAEGQVMAVQPPDAEIVGVIRQ